MKFINMSFHWWMYVKIQSYANEKGVSIRVAIRLIIGDFFKDKTY